MKNLTSVTGMQRLNPTSTAFNGKNAIDFSVAWVKALAVGFDPLHLLVTLKQSFFLVLVCSGKIQEFEGRCESLAQNGGMVTSWTISTYWPEKDKGKLGIKHFKWGKNKAKSPPNKSFSTQTGRSDRKRIYNHNKY